MRSVLFIGCLYSDNQKDIFKKNSKRGYQFAAQNLQEALLEGFLRNNVNLKVLTIPSLSLYPMGYKKPYVEDADFIFKKNIIGKSIGYRNIVFLRKIHKKALYNNIDNWYISTNGKKDIVVYGLHLNLMKIAISIKEKYSDVKLNIIIPDLPRFMGCNKYYKLLGLKEKANKNIYRLVREFDSSVVLAEPMIRDLNMAHKPFTVVEGIYDLDVTSEESNKENYKTILYTGNINEKYGILHLLDAFESIKEPNYRLWIRGNGNTKEEILKRNKKDSRITYFEPMNKEELLRLQKKATLLVNPVSSNQEFTRYFFPSKTMDYLASGTPVLMYKLDCLPQEYYDYLYFIKGDSVKCLAEQIKQICEKSPMELKEQGMRAKNFIRNQKNPQIQVKKIINLLDLCYE